MQIDNQIASHRWRLRRANSNHIPDGTPSSGPGHNLVYGHSGGVTSLDKVPVVRSL